MSDPAAANPWPNECPASIEEELGLANRKLEEAHKMAFLGRLSAGIVHEINTPIGSILANNETIRRSIESLKNSIAKAQSENSALPPRAMAILDMLASLNDIDKLACERIHGIVRSLKTFARVNESDLREINIHDLLQNTIKLTGAVFKRRVQVNTEFSEDVPNVECFPALLGQVFLNLMVNASQAIPGEGTITVRTERQGDTVHISIHDTGTGIPPEVRPKIFEGGFTTKPLGEGTGLGLKISREIVEDTHRGRISFESDLGVGTTFHVWVPIRQPRTEEQS